MRTAPCLHKEQKLIWYLILRLFKKGFLHRIFLKGYVDDILLCSERNILKKGLYEG